MFFCVQMSKLSYEFIPLTFKPSMARPKASLQNLCNISRKVRDEVDFLCRWASQLTISWYYHFWWVWPGMPKVLTITSTQFLCNISTKKWVLMLIFCMLIHMGFFYKLIILFIMCLTRNAQINQVNLQYLCDILIL